MREARLKLFIITFFVIVMGLFFVLNVDAQTLNTFKNSTDNNYEFEISTNKYEAFFSDDIKSGKANRFRFQNFWITYDLSGGKMQWDTPKSISSIKSSTAIITNNKITYVDAFSFTDVEYEVLNNQQKESFILKQLPSGGKIDGFLEYIGDAQFSSDLEIYANGIIQDGKEFNTTGNIQLRDGVMTRITLPKAFAIDSIGSQVDVMYVIKPNTGKLTFTLRIPFNWLSDPARVYPIIIDPSAVSGCTETADLIDCSSGTFTGNFIDTTKNILIDTATMNANDEDGGLRLNSTLGWINITSSTIQADGNPTNNNGQFVVQNAPEGLLITSSSIDAFGTNDGCASSNDNGGTGLCSINILGNITLDDSKFICSGGNGCADTNNCGSGATGTWISKSNALNIIGTRSDIIANGGGGTCDCPVAAGGNGDTATVTFNDAKVVGLVDLNITANGGNGALCVGGSCSNGGSNFNINSQFFNYSGQIIKNAGGGSCSAGANTFNAKNTSIKDARLIFRNGALTNNDDFDIMCKEFTLDGFTISDGGSTKQVNITEDVGRIGLFGASSIASDLTVIYGGNFGEMIIGNKTAGLTLGSINFTKRDNVTAYNTYYGPLTKQTSPANGTLAGATTTFQFDSIDDNNLKNITLHIWNSTGSLITDGSNNQNISGTSNSSSIDYTFASGGNYTWSAVTYNTNNIGDFFTRLNNSIEISIVEPNIVIDYITTTEGSQSITFNGTMSDDVALDLCWYTITNSTGGVDPSTTENTTFTCNTEQMDTVSTFATYNLTMYANDTFGNENSSIQEFTTTASSPVIIGGGGGGSSSSSEALNFTITTTNGQSNQDVLLAKSSVRPREKSFLLINTELDIIELKIECDTTDANVSSQGIEICDFVIFEQDTFQVSPNLENPTIGTYTISTPENSEIGDEYFFNLVAIKKDGTSTQFSKLSVSARTTILGSLLKWNSPFWQDDKPEDERFQYPVFGLSLIVGILSFAFFLFVFLRFELKGSGVLLATGLSFVLFSLGIIFF